MSPICAEQVTEASRAQGSALPAEARTARVYHPAQDLRQIASAVAERAWSTKGVRVFRWPCGTLVVTNPGSTCDAVLCRKFGQYILATWSRGTTMAHVLAELRGAGDHA